jgi:hypothetical protein
MGTHTQNQREKLLMSVGIIQALGTWKWGSFEYQGI